MSVVMGTTTLVARPRVALITAVVLSAVLVAAALFGWWKLPTDIRERFTVPQVGTLLFFVAVMVAMMLGIGLCRVRADDRGVQIRNGCRTRFYPWSEVRGVRFRTGDPWAYLLVDNSEQRRLRTGERIRRQQMIAIQSIDGQRAEQAVSHIVERARQASGA